MCFTLLNSCVTHFHFNEILHSFYMVGQSLGNWIQLRGMKVILYYLLSIISVSLFIPCIETI